VFNRQGSAGEQIRRFLEDRMVMPRQVELTRRFEDLLASVNEFKPAVFRGIPVVST
jgi:hypothetical protein